MQHDTAAAKECGFAIISHGVCLSLLGSEDIGHLGLTSGALPVVLPIRYRLVGRSVVFATAGGATLTSARRNAVACLEIAGTDSSTGMDWTVLATGRLREITDRSAISAGDGGPLRPWGLPAAEHMVALDIELLSGSQSRAQ